MASPPTPKTALILGATRGIGLELTCQLLAQGHHVIATARSPTTAPNPHPPPQATPKATGNASQLWALTGTPNGRNLTVLECDVADEGSVERLREEVRGLGLKGRVSGGVLAGGVLDLVVVVAGVLEYPGRVSEVNFPFFTYHLLTNTIGPLIAASQILSLSTPPVPPPTLPPPSQLLSSSTTAATLPSTIPLSTASLSSFNPIHTHTLIFLSSDSGSTTNFRSFEDGFGVYSASKAALNQGLRHLAAEVHKKYEVELQAASFTNLNSTSSSSVSGGGEFGVHKPPVILAVHPGEVATDMAANAAVDWDVEGIISVQESVRGILRVWEEKGWGGGDEGGRRSALVDGRVEEDGAATFWTWEGRRYPW